MNLGIVLCHQGSAKITDVCMSFAHLFAFEFRFCFSFIFIDHPNVCKYKKFSEENCKYEIYTYGYF